MTGPSDDEFRAYLDAARKGNARVVGLFVKKYPVSLDARPWFTDTTALKEAAAYGHKHLVELLLDAGADINQCDSVNFKTPLMAASLADKGCTLLLLDRGAYIEAKNRLGETAVGILASIGRNEMITLLLDRGADVHAGKDRGFTPLRAAAHYGHAETVKLLLQRGASSEIDLKDAMQMTPLMWAANAGSKEMAHTLLEWGAKTDSRNQDGETAFDIARKKGHEDIAALILRGVPRIALPAPQAASKEDPREAVLAALKKRAADRPVRLKVRTPKP